MRNQTPKKRILLRGAAAALALCMVLGFTACGKKKAPAAIRVDLSGRVNTLDPQYCTTPPERCLIKNCMEGLMRRMPDGTVTEGCADRYDISENGLRYTFVLREGLTWSDGEPLTAQDFVFALRRMQGMPQTAARERFAAVLGFGEGETLGVTAPDERTLIIRLTKADPLLPEKLAEPEAFPCREDYYNGTHARYGNTLENMIYNGPYLIKSWEKSEIRLTPNSRYTGRTPAENTGVVITLGQDDTVGRFLAGKTDCCRVDPTTLGQLTGGKASLLTFRNGTVSLLLNQNAKGTDQLALRQALCYSFELQAFAQSGDLPDPYEYARSIIPAAAKLFNASYTDVTARGFALGTVTYPDGSSTSDFRRSDQLTVRYHAGASAALHQQEKQPEGLTLLLPKGSPLEGFCGWLQKQWLDHLGLVVNLAIVDADTYRTRLAKGDFTLALYSYTAGDELHTVFRHYGSAGSAPVRCSDPRYDQLVDMASASRNVTDAARLYANAEALLADQFIAMPLFYTESYFAMAAGVTGIAASADGTELFFAGAKREG